MTDAPLTALAQQFSGVCESDAFFQAAEWLSTHEQHVSVIGLSLTKEPETGHWLLVLAYQD
jgi:hypothetical protein